MNIKELLSPDVDLSSLQAKAEELIAAIEAKTRSLKNAPEGRLRIAQRKSGVYYFHVTDSSPEWGDYLPLAELKTIEQLAQKEYDQTVLAEMQRLLKILDRFLKSFRPQRLHDIFARMLPARQKHVHPVHLPDEEYASRWLSVKYKGKPFSEESPELVTSRGERVRSKSEVIIANVLASLQIPYRYEFPHELRVPGKGCELTGNNRKSNGKRSDSPHAASRDFSRDTHRAVHRATRSATFHPDFTCLNVRTRKEYIWEHFGLMDDPAYTVATIGKLETCIANGIFPGDGLIFTMETQDHPLNPATVEQLAKHFLV